MTAKLTSRIPLIIADLKPSVLEALKEGGEAIAEGAKERVPVLTGTLRDAIHVEEVEDGVSIVAGDDDAWYGHIVENGSVHTPPRPFLIPAFEAERDHLEQLIEDKLEDL